MAAHAPKNAACLNFLTGGRREPNINIMSKGKVIWAEIELPYVFKVDTEVYVDFEDPGISPIPGIIAAVRYNRSRPRYDIDLQLSGGRVTRIPAVDSFYVRER